MQFERFGRKVKRMVCVAALAICGLVRADTGVTLEEATAQSAGALLAAQRGTPVLAVIYASSCSRSRAAFPRIIELANRHSGKAVVVAFGIDSTPEPLRQFLLGRALPFAPRWIKPWQKGELVKAFKPVGINVAGTLEMPLMAVLGRDGKLVKQWSPATNLAEVESVLEKSE